MVIVLMKQTDSLIKGNKHCVKSDYRQLKADMTKD